MALGPSGKKTTYQLILSYLFTTIGAFLAAAAIQIFLLPNKLIDGGIIGISMILTRLFGETYFSLFYIGISVPFIYLSYRFIRRTFVIQMAVAVVLFSVFLTVLERAPSFLGDPLEIIVIGGAILGIGAGLIIRFGGCLDGTEILAIIINKRYGFTVGQVILFINIFIFGAYGVIFYDWHIALQSLMTYIVAFKMMDIVIVGLDELKSVMIISNRTEDLAQVIMNKLGLGLTVMYGRGGYSGDPREILFVIVERLDLADLKELVLRTDPTAFISVQNLHEVVYGKPEQIAKKSSRRKKRA